MAAAHKLEMVRRLFNHLSESPRLADRAELVASPERDDQVLEDVRTFFSETAAQRVVDEAEGSKWVVTGEEVSLRLARCTFPAA